MSSSSWFCIMNSTWLFLWLKRTSLTSALQSNRTDRPGGRNDGRVLMSLVLVEGFWWTLLFTFNRSTNSKITAIQISFFRAQSHLPAVQCWLKSTLNITLQFPTTNKNQHAFYLLTKNHICSSLIARYWCVGHSILYSFNVCFINFYVPRFARMV